MGYRCQRVRWSNVMQLTAYMYTRSDVRHAVSTRYLPKHHNCISNAWTPNNDCWYKWSVWLKPNIPNLEFGLISCVHGYVVNLQLPELKKRYYYSNEILRRQPNKILHIFWWRLYFFRWKTWTNVYDTIRRGWGMFAWLCIYACSSCVLNLLACLPKLPFVKTVSSFSMHMSVWPSDICVYIFSDIYASLHKFTHSKLDSFNLCAFLYICCVKFFQSIVYMHLHTI